MSFADAIDRPGLDAEISMAFAPSSTAAFVGKLIGEAERALAAATTAAEQARLDALDPTLSSSAHRNSRGLMEDAAFRRDRLQAAVEKLRERLALLKDKEEDARRRADYDKAAENRDEVAKQLADFYPEFAEKLVDLLSRLVASNYELGLINARLPKGAARLEPAELVAKGTVGRPVLGAVSVTECYLPPWTPHSPHRWPPVK